MQPSLLLRCPKCGQPIESDSIETVQNSPNLLSGQQSKPPEKQLIRCACGAQVQVQRPTERQMM
jgi:hypothetical protein